MVNVSYPMRKQLNEPILFEVRQTAIVCSCAALDLRNAAISLDESNCVIELIAFGGV